MNNKKNKFTVGTVVFSLMSIVWIMPILMVFINSFKKKTYISKEPFSLPSGRGFVGLDNYISGMEKIDFFKVIFNYWVFLILLVEY